MTEFLRLRNGVQLIVFLVTVGIGIQFYVHVHQVFHGDPITVTRPPGVEGFLPIGGLLAWKNFLLTGIWDPIHPAAMVIIGFAGIISLFLRKSFCGWLCPIGTLSEWLWKAGGRLLGRNYRIPHWLDYPLRSLKYILLGFFFWVVLSMDRNAVRGFLQGPYYKMADVNMLYFFTRMSALTAMVLGILTLSSLFIRNFWCRYLCPYGALMGLFALLSPTLIQRDPTNCIDCRRCLKTCPYHLPVHIKTRIRSPECNGCMECALVCPVKDTLQLNTKGFGKKSWSPVRLSLVIIGSFIVFVYVAEITGHWRSSVTAHEFQMRLQGIDSQTYMHPTIEK